MSVITTRYSIGDTVWACGYHNDRKIEPVWSPFSMEITEIQVNLGNHMPTIYSCPGQCFSIYNCTEDDLFDTEAEAQAECDRLNEANVNPNSLRLFWQREGLERQPLVERQTHLALRWLCAMGVHLPTYRNRPEDGGIDNAVTIDENLQDEAWFISRALECSRKWQFQNEKIAAGGKNEPH